MTDLEWTTDGGEAEGPGWIDAEGLPLEATRELLVVLGKAFRAFQLYDENNPVRQRFVEGLRRSFKRLWDEVDRLDLKVDEDRILLGPEEVYRSETRSDSLAFLFYKDGVREISFVPGLEEAELERFLGVLQRARKLVPEGDDLLTVLWDEDLQYFEYQYVDFLAEGVEVPDPGMGASEEVLRSLLEIELVEEGEEDTEEPGAEAAPAAPQQQTVRQEDFNPTLYALDAKDQEVLRREVHKEAYRDLRGDVLSALFDRLEESDQPDRQDEILNILRTLLPNFLSRGVLPAATRILEELSGFEKRPGVLGERQMVTAVGVLDGVSSSESIDELIRSLYDGSLRASPKQLSDFLSHLRVGAMKPLLRAAETVDHKELRGVLRAAVQGLAGRYPGAVVALLEDPEAVIASGAARLAGDAQIAQAGPALAHLLAHDESSVRLAAVEAARDLRASTAAGALVHTLDDPERDVRIAAARALGELEYSPAADELRDILGSRELRGADVSEKVAFFEAYGSVAGEAAVPLLDKLLNGKGFLGRREPSDMRAAAAHGLGKVGSPAAKEALEQARAAEDPVVRSAVGRALRGES